MAECGRASPMPPRLLALVGSPAGQDGHWPGHQPQIHLVAEVRAPAPPSRLSSASDSQSRPLGRINHMARYLVETNHTARECTWALKNAIQDNPEFLSRFEWGCKDG